MALFLATAFSLGLFTPFSLRVLKGQAAMVVLYFLISLWLHCIYSSSQPDI
jgi:hypothetical protein